MLKMYKCRNINGKRFVEDEFSVDYLIARGIPIWEADADVLFDGTIEWTNNGSGYINHNDVPNHSVGFWDPDRALNHNIYYNKHRYSYHNALGWKNITYVGFEEPVLTIPQGTLLRVCLARWWNTDGTTEDRCSLQLSGWYRSIGKYKQNSYIAIFNSQ